MSEADFIFRSMKTHHVLVILVVDTRVLSCVADSLQERRFASISPTDYEDTKASIFRSKLIGIKVAHGRCGWVKGEWERCGSVARVGTLLTITSPNGTFCFVPSKTDSLATLLWNYVHPIRQGWRRNMECMSPLDVSMILLANDSLTGTLALNSKLQGLTIQNLCRSTSVRSLARQFNLPRPDLSKASTLLLLLSSSGSSSEKSCSTPS